jgi:sugar phosphate isomerase/epimerase
VSRPVTLFTGQWADLPLHRLCELASGWGYDGVELASWGDHFDVVRALDDDAYLEDLKAMLERSGLSVFAVSNHLVGQAVCDTHIDDRHRAILPARVWGDGDPDGVRDRAAAEMMTTARAAAKLGVKVVTGFTGSPIWHLIAMFPPVDTARLDEGFSEFETRWRAILDVFDEVNVRFALEVHPGEIAYDYWTTQRVLSALRDRPAFGLNFDPSHLLWQSVDPVAFLWDFRHRIYHVHVKDVKLRMNGRGGCLSSHLPWGDPRRGWDFVSPGHGDVPWEECIRMLNAIDYTGPLSVEWEDAGMTREIGAADALRFTRAVASIQPAERRFDAAFSSAQHDEPTANADRARPVAQSHHGA